LGDGKTLARSYSTLKHWDQWLAQHFLGTNLLHTEEKIITQLLGQKAGKQVLLLGVPHQQRLLKAISASQPDMTPHSAIVTPLVSHAHSFTTIDADFHELPILTGSIDLVILPHTLEFVEAPRQLLSEACRIIKPEGLIVVCGFNPYSFYGLKKIMSNHKSVPWSGNFIQKGVIKNWLQLSDFALEAQSAGLFRPPLAHARLHQHLRFLDPLGTICFPFLGGVYILLARAKVIPLTPIRLKWKQQLSNVRISTISGYIARQSK